MSEKEVNNEGILCFSRSSQISQFNTDEANQSALGVLDLTIERKDMPRHSLKSKFITAPEHGNLKNKFL